LSISIKSNIIIILCYKPLKTGHKDKTRDFQGGIGMTELLLGERVKGTLKTSLLQYPAVFEKALYKLSWAQAPKAILEEYKQKALAHKKAPINVLADHEERAWAMWGSLQKAHAID
jgi:hypothetical protein